MRLSRSMVVVQVARGGVSGAPLILATVQSAASPSQLEPLPYPSLPWGSPGVPSPQMSSPCGPWPHLFVVGPTPKCPQRPPTSEQSRPPPLCQPLHAHLCSAMRRLMVASRSACTSSVGSGGGLTARRGGCVGGRGMHAQGGLVSRAWARWAINHSNSMLPPSFNALPQPHLEPCHASIASPVLPPF